MSDLDDLYQAIIVDHSKRPRNHGPLGAGSRRGEGYNPLCGDQIAVHVRLDGDSIAEASFEGHGCALAVAAASLMTSRVRGMTAADAASLFERFTDLLRGRAGAGAELGDLAAFAGVARFPVRAKCATLPWRALLAALERDGQTVSTE